MKTYFRRSLIFLNITPLFCYIQNIDGCFGEGDFATIYIKTNQIIFFISGSMSLKNIILKGNDMPLEMINNSACYSQKKICCIDGNKEKIPSSEYSLCFMNFNQTNFFIEKFHSYGLFTLESTFNIDLIPNILIENCQLFTISTFFPDNEPRFSSLIKIMSSSTNITLKNMQFINCTMVEGVLTQALNENNLLSLRGEGAYQKVTIKNISFYNYKRNYFKENTYYIAFMYKYEGDIELDSIYLGFTTSSKIIFLNLNDISSNISIRNVFYGDNKDLCFLHCKFCKVVDLEGVTFMRSSLNLLDGNNFIDILSSELVLFKEIVITSLSFNQSWGISNSININKIVKIVEFYDFQIQKTNDINIKIECFQVKWQNLLVRELVSHYKLLTLQSTSAIFQNTIFSVIKIYSIDFCLVTLMSGGGINNVSKFQVLEGYFLDIIFINNKKYNGIFEWPIFKKTDEFFMSRVSIFNCSNYFLQSYFRFFLEMFFGIVRLESVDFSFQTKGQNSLLILVDINKINLYNISFRKNGRVDYYLIVIICSECTVNLYNVKVEEAIFTYGCFFFKGGSSGFYENFTFIGISGVLPSPIYGYIYSFNYGLIIFSECLYCIAKNWSFRSSDTHNFYPCTLFRSTYNAFILLQNISLYLSLSNMSKLPQVHILTSDFTAVFVLKSLTAENFFCQCSIFGNTLYEAGIISMFNTPTFLPEINAEGQVELIDIFVKNCKFCDKGAICIINMGVLFLNNISIYNSESTKGGALAIYSGIEISIDTLIILDSSASKYGGALFSLKCSTFKVSNAFINNTQALMGGALYFREIRNLSILNLNTFNNFASLSGGVLYFYASNINLEGGSVLKYLSLKDGGCMFIKRGNIQIVGFKGISGSAENGAFISALEVEQILLKNITVKNNSVKSEGISFILEDCTGLFVENITLSDLQSISGFGNMVFIMRYKSAIFEIKNVLCLRVFMFSSVLFHLENELNFQKEINFTISNVQILDCQGSVAYLSCSNLNKQQLFIIQNITISNFNTNFSSPVNEISLPDEVFAFYSTNIMIKHILVLFLAFRVNCIFLSNSNITLDNFHFLVKKNVYLPPRSKFIFCSYNTSLRFLYLSFLGEKTISSEMAFIFADNSLITLEKGIIFKCNSHSTSCIEIYKSSAHISSSLLIGNYDFQCGVLNSRDSTLITEESYFKANGMGTHTSLGVNNIAIFGENLGKISIIRYCHFFENKTGVSVFVNNSNLVISFCNFHAFSIKTIDSPLKALWSISSDLEINWSSFTNFISKNGGTFNIEHKANIGDSKLFTLQFSSIFNSISDFGGVFSLFGILSINISRNFFCGNKALKNYLEGYGNFGVGVFICTFCSNSSFYLLSNQFLNNFAEYWMPTVFSNYQIRTSFSQSLENDIPLDSNNYLNNSDGTNFKGNLSYFPLKIKYLISFPSENQLANQSINQAFIQNLKNYSIDSPIIRFKSGMHIDLEFFLSDYLEETYIFNGNSKAIIGASKVNITFFQMSNIESFLEKGKFVFKNFIINADLNKSFELKLIISLNGYYLYPEYREFVKVEPLYLKFFTNPCEVGEIIIEGDSSCFKCPPGKYSITDPMEKYYGNASLDDLKCLDCPIHAKCLGGSIIVPTKGFWRYSNKSTTIVECLSKFSCLGLDNEQLLGEEVIHGRCQKNSLGPLCYTCEPGYGRFSKKGICRPCANEIASYTKLTLIILMFLIYSLVQIKLVFEKKRTSSAGILLKIIITHFQQLSLISLIDLGWTPEFEAYFSLQEAFAYLTENYLPLECLLQNFGYNVYTQKVLATNVYPVVLSFIVFLLWITSITIIASKSSVSKIKVFQIIQVTFFIVILILFPEVVSKCMSLLTCLKVDDLSSTELLLYSPEVLCWSQEHHSYILNAALPGLIVWGFVAPLILAYHLFKYKNEIKIIIEQGKRKKVKSEKVNFNLNSRYESTKSTVQGIEKAISLKFLCKGYSSQYFYWELFIFLKKFLLISIGCITDLFPSKVRGVFLLIPISFFLLVQIRCQPFETSILNKLEFLSLMTIFLTADVGILMFSNDFKEYALPISIFVIGINGLFILIWLVQFFKEVAIIIREKYCKIPSLKAASVKKKPSEEKRI